MIPKLLEPQTSEDKAEALSFSAALTGDIKSFDVEKAADYLDELRSRIVPSMPSGLKATAQ
jgi:hypothetical protein